MQNKTLKQMWVCFPLPLLLMLLAFVMIGTVYRLCSITRKDKIIDSTIRKSFEMMYFAKVYKKRHDMFIQIIWGMYRTQTAGGFGSDETWSHVSIVPSFTMAMARLRAKASRNSSVLVNSISSSLKIKKHSFTTKHSKKAQHTILPYKGKMQ